MRVLKNQLQNQTEKPTLKIPTKTGDESPGDVLTPGSFDPDGFDIDFMDMMQYPPQYNPFFTGDMYSYPTMPFDGRSGAGHMYNDDPDNDPNDILSPGSTQDGDPDTEVGDVTSVAPEVDDAEEIGVEPLSAQTKPMKKYSMNVKVKPPDVLSLLRDQGLILSNSDDETSYADLLGGVTTKTDSTTVGQTLPLEQKDSGMQRNRTLSSNPAVFSGRQIHPKVEEDAALFVHDYPSSVESVVEVESSLNNSTSSMDTSPQEPSVSSAAVTSFPQGTIVLQNGTILIPASNKNNDNNHQTDLSATSALPGSSARQLTIPSKSTGISSSSIAPNTSGYDSVMVDAVGLRQVRQKQTQKNQLPVMVRLVNSAESGAIPDSLAAKKIKLEQRSPEAIQDYGPATPTSSTSVSASDGDGLLMNSDRRGITDQYQDTVSDLFTKEDNVRLKAKADRSKRSRSKATKLAIEDSKAEQRRSSKMSKVTPVSTITNIVDISRTEENGDLLKEATSKPIKHRMDVDSVESAKERSVKNAINARVNRQKHKVYVQTIEEENAALKEETITLKKKNEILQEEKDILNKEVIYLKKVIANQSSLAHVLSGLSNLKDVTLTSSFANSFKQVRKKSADSSADSVSTSDRSSALSPGSSVVGGVCVHVSGEKASLELCQKCAEMASHSAD